MVENYNFSYSDLNNISILNNLWHILNVWNSAVDLCVCVLEEK